MMAFYDILLIYRRLSRDARWAYSFMLVHKENLNAYTMLARTEDEKNKWIEAIREAFDNEVPPQSFTSTHEPVMTTFDKPTTCSYCNKMLKGLFWCFHKLSSIYQNKTLMTLAKRYFRFFQALLEAATSLGL